MTEKILVEELKKINIELTNKQLLQLQIYYEALVTWTEKFNLTTITNKEDVYLKHFYDSLAAAKVYYFPGNKFLCDIGSGAGFPGIVLKIAFPSLNLTLVESNAKKCSFLNNVVETLKLEDVKIINDRIETFARKNRDQYDIVINRAVANLSILLEFSMPLLKLEGHMIALKGYANEELTNANNAFQILGAKLIQKEEFTLPIEGSFRSILLIQKIKNTNPKYPREFNKMKKKPL